MLKKVALKVVLARRLQSCSMRLKSDFLATFAVVSLSSGTTSARLWSDFGSDFLVERDFPTATLFNFLQIFPQTSLIRGLLVPPVSEPFSTARASKCATPPLPSHEAHSHSACSRENRSPFLPMHLWILG